MVGRLVGLEPEGRDVGEVGTTRFLIRGAQVQFGILPFFTVMANTNMYVHNWHWHVEDLEGRFHES